MSSQFSNRWCCATRGEGEFRDGCLTKDTRVLMSWIGPPWQGLNIFSDIHKEKHGLFNFFIFRFVEKPWQYIGDVWFGNVAAASTSISNAIVMGNRIPSRRLPHFRNWNNHLSLMHSNNQFFIHVLALSHEYFFECSFKFDLWIWEDTHPDVYSCQSCLSYFFSSYSVYNSWSFWTICSRCVMTFPVRWHGLDSLGIITGFNVLVFI